MEKSTDLNSWPLVAVGMNIPVMKIYVTRTLIMGENMKALASILIVLPLSLASCGASDQENQRTAQSEIKSEKELKMSSTNMLAPVEKMCPVTSCLCSRDAVPLMLFPSEKACHAVDPTYEFDWKDVKPEDKNGKACRGYEWIAVGMCKLSLKLGIYSCSVVDVPCDQLNADSTSQTTTTTSGSSPMTY